MNTIPRATHGEDSPQISSIGKAIPDRILHLRETAPVELIETRCRVLARLYHPDHGGDDASMRELNDANAALTARVSA